MDCITFDLADWMGIPKAMLKVCACQTNESKAWFRSFFMPFSEKMDPTYSTARGAYMGLGNLQALSVYSKITLNSINRYDQ